jgi:Short C-terminal domain/Phospholipase_D-nuclease N-terminal
LARPSLDAGPRRGTFEGVRRPMTFNDIFASMIVFFFWFMAIWIFIAVFADIFRRNDLSGLAKAGWIVVIFIIPFVGALIYIIARPKMTAQDVQMMARADAANKAAAAVSPADEIAKLQQLKDAGTITQAEFDTLKQKALAG